MKHTSTTPPTKHAYIHTWLYQILVTLLAIHATHWFRALGNPAAHQGKWPSKSCWRITFKAVAWQRNNWQGSRWRDAGEKSICHAGEEIVIQVPASEFKSLCGHIYRTIKYAQPKGSMHLQLLKRGKAAEYAIWQACDQVVLQMPATTSG